jgi:hypothetical protein
MPTTDHLTDPRRLPLARFLHATAAAALLCLAIAAFTSTDTGWWVFPMFGLGPDLAFLAGIGQGVPIERGQMPSRAVPLYNALHRLWGPLALTAAGLVPAAPDWVLVAGLIWGFHVAFDRALGYGLRTADGRQRD